MNSINTTNTYNSNNSIKYILALKFCPLLGDSLIKKLLYRFKAAEKIWRSSENKLLSVYGLGERNIENIGKEEYLLKAENEIKYCDEKGIKLLSIEDKEYPNLLKECNDAPLLIYSQGNINWNREKLIISIVGTRNMTIYGKKCIEDLLNALKCYKDDIIIVSGLALGVDGWVHKKCIEYEIPTLGVLAHGLKNNIYPAEHKNLAQLMIQNGGLLSEFSLSVKPERYNFIQRNRIIAGLSSLTIIVESDFGGGAISTAKFANSYNREVFAFPGRIGDKYSQGCNQLINKLEANILVSSKQILSFLKEKKSKEEKQIIQKELFVELTQEEMQIIDYLRDKGISHIDNLSIDLNQPYYLLMMNLLNLEIKNAIQVHPAKYYESII